MDREQSQRVLVYLTHVVHDQSTGSAMPLRPSDWGLREEKEVSAIHEGRMVASGEPPAVEWSDKWSNYEEETGDAPPQKLNACLFIFAFQDQVEEYEGHNGTIQKVVEEVNVSGTCCQDDERLIGWKLKKPSSQAYKPPSLAKVSARSK